MKRLLTFVVVLFFIACNNDELYTPLSEATRFHATIEEESTRTFVDEKIRLRWTAEDLISLFEGTTRNKKFMFLGETGDNAGDFEDKTTGFGSGNDVNRYYALYPYASTNKLHEDGYITYTFPTEQTYAENSFGMAANPMVAITEDLNDYDLSFKNVGGYLRLYLFGDDVTIKSIKIEGNDSEPIAGKSIITPVYGGNPAVEMDATATTAVTLNCGEGVAVGSTAETSTPFWIVLPPTTFAEGFTLTITDVNDNEFTKCITSNVNIQRNKYISARIEVDFTVPVPETWKIYYTATGKLNYKSNAFEVNVVSDEWDSTTGEGVITFDGEVTSIGSGAFSASTTLTSITIPDSVTEIGTYTFYDCYNLTNISLPNGLIAIGNNAFRDCSNLQNITIPNGMTTIEYYTFAGCTSLASVTIPNSVTKIDYAAFADCSSLVSITIPDGVAEIASEMFCRCTSLINVVIPESVTAIKESVFAGCSSLVNVTIPDSVTEIRRWAFRDCTSLKSLTITDEVTTIGNK